MSHFAFIVPTTAVSIGFEESEIDVSESETAVPFCLELSNVLEPTQAEIWADVSTAEGSAMGEYATKKMLYQPKVNIVLQSISHYLYMCLYFSRWGRLHGRDSHNNFSCKQHEWRH